MKKILIALISSIFPLVSVAQCFSSSGNPVGGSNNMGVLDKKSMTVMGYYRYGFSDKFFEGNKPSDLGILRNANYNLLGTLIAYGLSNKVTLEAELGYFINRTKNYQLPAGFSLTGYGLTNGLVSGKYQLFYNPEKKFEYSASLGIKFPFTLASQSVDNVRLPFDLQPSTSTAGAVFQSYLIKEHSFNGMRYFMYNRVEINATNRDGYRFGNVFINSLFISKHLIRTSDWPVSITLIIQVRNETRGRTFINQDFEPSSGSVKFFLSPQFNLAFSDKWFVSGMIDIPMYQYYNNYQIADKLGFSLVLVKPIPMI